MKKITYTILTISIMALIFYFSNQNGIQSNATSDMLNFLPFSMYHIRKLAHFSIYAALGFSSCLMFKSYGCKHYHVFSILFCILYAASDEFHQMFVSQRSPQIFDVFIDSCGASCINILLFGIFRGKNIQN